MPKQIVIAEQHRIAAVFSEDQIQELIVATGSHQISDIYLGIVENVLPGIDAAFVNIGDSERNGFIHVTDLGPLRLKRTAGSITELLAPQQKVLVQVMKEPTGNKGPRLTGKITLPGRYLVLMPYGRGVNLSRHIRSESERNRLRALAVLIKPAGMGMIVRTEAEGMTEETIAEDLETLLRQWESIQQEATSTRAPALLNRDDDFIQRVLRDVYNADVNRIVVDSPTGVKRIKQYLTNWSSGRSPQGVLIDQHRERTHILEYFRVNAAIREALKPRVDLPSGGYIIIQPTEALTVIDVNSGSFTRSATARETVLWTNCEAATEIARQLRLRNMAGVIIVDFIDMDSRRDQLQVLESFNRALRADKARPQIVQLSELGLVELTRKRQGQNIYELFGRSCPTCGGLGHLVHLPGESEPADGEVVGRTLVKENDRRNRFSSPEYGRRGRDAAPPEILAPADLTPTVEDWEDQDESDFGSDDSDGDLEILAVPGGYSDRGGPNNRRRRRRRNEGGKPESEGRQEPNLYGRRGRGGSHFSSDTAVLEERPTLVEKGRNRIIETEPAEPPLAEAAPPPSNREPWAARGDRRSNRRDNTRASQPLEVVAIEMTPEEQEVYSWMGVSPLVLLNQEGKDPKSIAISVVLPGQKPVVTPSEPEVVAEVTRELPSIPTPREVREVREVPPEVPPVNVASAVEAEESALTGVEAPDSPNSRRRRRRSSATE